MGPVPSRARYLPALLVPIALLAIPPRSAPAHPIFGKGPPQIASADPLVDLRASAPTVTPESRNTSEEADAPGEVSGFLAPAERAGTWSMGSWKDGLELHFDMGRRRVNWNHVRLAVLELPQPRDLSGHDGLRLVVTTEAPRDDVEVSVWLREADGSWYYLKSAVPLVDRENVAAFYFEDLSEAEWVSPTNHMDEDYALDTTAISHVAIGVVNPLGVGEVRFTVRALEAIKILREPPFLARVAVTGTFFSTNGHDLVPPGLFGGFAPELPQEYRPGCQRSLYAPRYPRMPRQVFVAFDPTGDLRDWRRIRDVIAGEDPSRAALGVHLASLLDGPTLQRLLRFDPDRVKDSSRAPGEVLDALNALLGHKDLWDPEAFDDASLDRRIRDRGILDREPRTDTERMERNRRLLEAAFPAEIVPVSPQGPTELFWIDCYGERKQPADLLLNPHWEADLRDYARDMALAARENEYQGHFEFWNEPYLNWAERSRVNLQSRFYREDLAVEGGPVAIRRESRFSRRDIREAGGLVSAFGMEPELVPHLRWVRDMDAMGGAGNRLKVIDETAFTYWSGRGNGWIYDRMLEVFGKAIKGVDPTAQVIGGWGFRWHEDRWAAWDMLYRPTIDRNIEWIDGVHEHHYQGDTTAMNGSYEVLEAYVTSRHNRWLYCYNTETNDLVDAPARGRVDAPEKAAAAREYRRMVYNLRDIVYTVLQSPDKARSRTMIHPNATPDGTRVCFEFLRNLRGRLVLTRATDDYVWCVASVDGTDPRAMPPGVDGVQKLVAIVFNDYRREREVEVSVQAPVGTVFRGGVVERPTMDWRSFRVGLEREAVDVRGEREQFRVILPGRSAWKVSLRLEGTLLDGPELRLRQFFSGDILREVRRGKAFSTEIDLPRDAIEAATRAWLRAVVEDIAPAEARVSVGGREMILFEARTADNCNRIIEVPCRVGWLSEKCPIVFSVEDGNHAGYRVDMVSIVLEDRR